MCPPAPATSMTLCGPLTNEHALSGQSGAQYPHQSLRLTQDTCIWEAVGGVSLTQNRGVWFTLDVWPEGF